MIDHLETESEEKDPKERKENEKVPGELKIAYSKVSKEELEILDGLLKQVEEKYPDLNNKILKRTKRFGVMSWIMGWGVYSNWKQIKAIKKNIKKLYEQNLLQEQQIQDLAHYVNLTATRVQLHDKMLYNIQVRLNRIDHSIGTRNDIVTFNWVSNNMLLDANVIVNRLITGLIVLRNNVERIYVLKCDSQPGGESCHDSTFTFKTIVSRGTGGNEVKIQDSCYPMTHRQRFTNSMKS